MSEATVRQCDKCKKTLPAINREKKETHHQVSITQDGLEYEVEACSIAHLRAGLQKLKDDKGVR